MVQYLFQENCLLMNSVNDLDLKDHILLTPVSPAIVRFT
jgi:hypothetical protein